MFQWLTSKPNLKLAQQGVLGINARNLDYIFESNPRRFYPLVDDKLETKKLAEKAGIAFPKTYAVIRYQDQIRKFGEIIGDRGDFVVKPAEGSGGSGVMVIVDRGDNYFIKGSGHTVSMGDMQYHLNNTLSGLYSLGGLTDKAIVEYRVKSAKLFDAIAYQGVPDVRIIVYKGVPAMTMLRLPTRRSDGKANLHSGGIGVGISVQSGKTTFGVQHNHYVEFHPDTRVPIAGIAIPYWGEILHMASRFNSIIGLGYIGVDIVIDEEFGPMLLELNARPGIAIQIANQAGLKRRLQTIDKHIDTLHSVEDKVLFAMAHFV